MRNKLKLPPLVLLLFLPFFAAALVACGPSAQEKNTMNLDTGLVKIEIGNHRLDIPLRYMYGQSVETYGRWPTPKNERVHVGALSLSVLLPDMRPYYKEDDARWKALGHGERVEVDIAEGVPRGEPSRKLIYDYSTQGRRKREPDSYGLVHYSSETGDTYFTNNKANQDVWIQCDTLEPPPKWNGYYSPSCMIDSSYRSGLVIRYVYALNYLSQWEQIDNDLKALFDKFSQASQTTTITK